MKRKITKWKFFGSGDFQKEEDWLNNMSAHGWVFVKHKGAYRYIFEPCQPSQYTYRLDYFGRKSKKEVADYIGLVQETGADCVEQFNKWGYFRHTDPDFKLYSDSASKRRFLNEILSVLMMFILGLIYSLWNLPPRSLIWILCGLTSFLILSQIIRIQRLKHDLKKSSQPDIFEDGEV
ncbi:DUF2812 domain-containing protein [Streptococcus tangpeifui]|uniref:DUF2812 domain-containing protein n=1 Tax=Streptococcus tangpeifui TaxID=2709400 RepID=UPI0013EA7FF8|nr:MULTISPECIES: DUF2812 domain-containing protein [unclassified Streptococcus]